MKSIFCTTKPKSVNKIWDFISISEMRNYETRVVMDFADHRVLLKANQILFKRTFWCCADSHSFHIFRFVKNQSISNSM